MPRQSSNRRRAPKSKTAEVTIDSLGARGDGLARANGVDWFVPQTLPGDLVRVRSVGKRGNGLLGEVIEVVSRQIDPAESLCPHYGVCGGCIAQHLGAAREADWKRGRIVDALVRGAGLERDMAEHVTAAPITVPHHSRRRADFAARNLGGKVLLGFQKRAGRDVVDVRDCVVLSPQLAALLPPLREVLSYVLPSGKWGGVHATVTETGADLVFSLPDAPDLAGREVLAAFAEANGVARLGLDLGGGEAEALSARSVPVIRPGNADIPLPQRAFLQATAEGEHALRGLVDAAVADAKSVVELFAGIGTFGIPLAEQGKKVAAYELSERAVAAGRHAAGRSGLAYTAVQRDLFEDPLTEKELGKCDAVILDPPRAGAAAQAELLGRVGPSRIVYVSCYPESFARDAGVLIKGGYKLDAVTPVDQFRHAAHVELVGVFRRA